MLLCLSPAVFSYGCGLCFQCPGCFPVAFAVYARSRSFCLWLCVLTSFGLCSPISRAIRFVCSKISRWSVGLNRLAGSNPVESWLANWSAHSLCVLSLCSTRRYRSCLLSWSTRCISRHIFGYFIVLCLLMIYLLPWLSVVAVARCVPACPGCALPIIYV